MKIETQVTILSVVIALMGFAIYTLGVQIGELRYAVNQHDAIIHQALKGENQ